MREVAQGAFSLPAAFVWTPEPEHQSGRSDWGQPSVSTSGLLLGLERRLLVKELEQAQGGGRIPLSTGKESRAPATAGRRGMTEGGLRFGKKKKKTGTQTGAVGVGRDPFLDKDARTGVQEGHLGMCSQSPTEPMQMRPVCMQMRLSVCR